MNEENNEIIADDDMIEMDAADFNDQPDEEAQAENTSVVEEKTEQQTNAQVEAPTNDETKKVLDFLNAQDMKFNGEKVTIKDLEEFKTVYQKGLNYDKVKAKADSQENNSVMNFISDKAKSMGLTPEEYITKVQEYEKTQEKERIENDIADMVNQGIDEATARRVVESEKALKDVESLRKSLEARENEQREQENKNKEYEEFLKEYPNVQAADIPQEVFGKAQNGVSLLNAYREYENKLLKEKIKQLEQNRMNSSSSPVTLTSNGSPTSQEAKDDFLIGFDSEE